MRIYRINRLLILSITFLFMVSFNVMVIRLSRFVPKSEQVSEIEPLSPLGDNETRRIKLLWSEKSAVLAKGEYGDYTENDIIGDEEESINSLYEDEEDEDDYEESALLKEARFKLINGTNNQRLKREMISNGIYWSKQLDVSSTSGHLSKHDIYRFLKSVREKRVTQVMAPDWDRCGRAGNKFVIFEDGTKACARYRYPHQYLVLGEVMAFYLSRILGINSVPTSTLVTTENKMWSLVKDNIFGGENRGTEDPAHVGTEPSTERDTFWSPNTSLAIIQWVDDLKREKMPKLMASHLLNGGVISSQSKKINYLRKSNLIELVQWSDLIVFDYITANYDRVSSVLEALYRENNSLALTETVHNLVKSSKSNSIWLIDNESGILDGYALLYGENKGNDEQIRESRESKRYHETLLRKMCLFRESTVTAIERLNSHPDPGQAVIDLISRHEGRRFLNQLSFRYEDAIDVQHYAAFFKKHFKQRLEEVLQHVRRCRALG